MEKKRVPGDDRGAGNNPNVASTWRKKTCMRKENTVT